VSPVAFTAAIAEPNRIGTDEKGEPNGRMFGEAYLSDVMLMESNPGLDALPSHKNEVDHPDKFNCNAWCVGESFAKGACIAATAPPCEQSAMSRFERSCRGASGALFSSQGYLVYTAPVTWLSDRLLIVGCPSGDLQARDYSEIELLILVREPTQPFLAFGIYFDDA